MSDFLERARALQDKLSGPFREASLQADNQAFEMAKAIITSLFLLHGGGAVAVKALVVDQSSTCIIRVVLALFGSGILAALAAAIFGFFALSHRADSFQKLVDACANRGFYEASFESANIHEGHRAELNEKVTADEKVASAYHQKYLVMRVVGITLVVVSTVLLVAAGVVSIS